MRKYCILQLKRMLRVLPFALGVTAVLFGCLAVIFQTMVTASRNSEDQKKIQVGLVGTAGDAYLELGLAVLETFDSSRFAIGITAMEEQQAVKAMENGDIAAYVVIPEGFVDAAMRGQIKPLKYVGTSGAVGLVSMFKDEITLAINDILIASQKGIYGAGNAMSDNDQGAGAGKIVNDISIEYVEFVFSRSKVYSTEELGLSDGLGLEGYLFCGLTVLLLMLGCLPFAPLLVRKDISLARMLAARGRPVNAQVLCDFGVYLTGMLIQTTAVFAILTGIGGTDGFTCRLEAVAPVLLMVSTLSFLLYEITSDLISGVLLQFFTVLCLCFVSGCLYPAYFFPETVQELASLLPAGIARAVLSGCITGQVKLFNAGILVVYSCAFLLTAMWIRRCAVMRGRG